MEFWVLLFLFSGNIKEFIQFYELPVPFDLTLVALLGGGFHLAVLLLRTNIGSRFNKGMLIYLGLLTLFLFWVLVTVTYSPSYHQKFIKLEGLVANSMFIFYICLSPSLNIKKLIHGYVIVTSILAIIFLVVFGLHLNSPRLNEISGLYLGIGVMLGISALLVWFKFQEMAGWGRYRRSLYFLATCLLLMLYAARGPLVFLLFVVGFYELISLVQETGWWKRVRISKTVVVGRGFFFGVLIISMLFFSTTYGPSFIEGLVDRAVLRYSLLFDALEDGDGGGHSITQRIDYIDFTVESIWSSPQTFFVGNGLSSFGVLYTGEDIKDYPHNIILEVWFELGILGIVLLGAWMAFALSRMVVKNMGWIHLSVIVFCFLNAMKSGSLVDTRTLFTLMTLGQLGSNVKPYFTQNDKEGN